jgi:YfiH family protein
MKIIKSSILAKFTEVIFGFSTKIGLNRNSPYYFNMSFNVGDDNFIVAENREAFFKELNVNKEEVCFQKQIHSDIITYVDRRGNCGDSDALITDKPNLALTISSADCTPVFIYDSLNKIVAAIHSGWRGTQQKITLKTLNKLFGEFNSKPENLFVFIGPSISQKNYEVGLEVARLFDNKYVKESEGKYYLDVSKNNYDMIVESNIPITQIEYSNLCTFEESELLHSYRRDGAISGRALGLIYWRDDAH